jgi:hypothetical protein
MTNTMKKPKAKKRWGYDYVFEGCPATITFDGRDILLLVDRNVAGAFSQSRQVGRLLRALNKAKVVLK